MSAHYHRQEDWPLLPDGFGCRMVSNLAEDSQGRIYIVHRGRHPLFRLSPNGKFSESIGDDSITPSINYDLTQSPPSPISEAYWLHGLHIDPWDNIWTTDLGRHLILKFSPSGQLLLTLGCADLPGEELDRFNQPTAVVVGSLGYIYVADGYGNSRIVKYSPEGKPLLSWGKKGIGPGEFQTPHAIALDGDENVFVAERMNNRVQIFDSQGHHLAVTMQWKKSHRW